MAIAVADARWTVEMVDERIRRALVPYEQP